MAKKRDWRLLGMAAIGTIVIAAMWPGKQGKILSIQYVDGEDLVGLHNATLGLGAIDIVIYYMNTSSDPMDTRLALELVGPDGVPTELPALIKYDLHPNVEEPSGFTIILDTEGDYVLNVTLYEEGTMKELDRKSVGFSAREPVGPAEFALANLRIVPTTLEVNHVVNIYATITNVGGLAGSHTIYLTGDLSGHRSTGILNPGQGQELNFYQVMDIAGVYNIEFGGLPGSFTVTSVTPSIEAAGHIHATGFTAYLDGKWVDVTDKTVEVPSALELAVSWISDMSSAEPDIKGYISLHVQIKDPITGNLITEYDLTPTSGQGTQVAPNGLASVYFDLNINQEADYYLDAILDGEIA